MDNAATGAGTPPPPLSGGETLRAQRSSMGLSLEEVAARTRIPVRHLEAIEASDYSRLPSPTYAVGFAKAFARAVGADEVLVAGRVRDEVARLGRRQPDYTPFQVADPARVPSRTVAVLGIGAALALLVLAVLWFGTSMLRDGTGSAPSAATPAAGPVASAPVPAVRTTPPKTGQVSLLATDQVWLRVYDADNKSLYNDNMKPGERFDVPADAKDPKITVGRPDKLQVTLNGSAVPPLGTGERPIRGVSVSASAIAARLSAAGTSASGGPAASSAPTGPAPAPPAGASASNR
ncbi:protein RodZ, contains Xre-like HTH and DUF4115 domains [Sphingomonas gellani]|uniref:Protein RodZ, contains Xre-like HTH and DUF4115 domains n=1 Tax=Sphingomonas gellani TaxID=1166340 RepID=A0A1H8IX47_9SPHN|nr:helix-turn-helix domain-containing protein [Sphingomonas gellani]SEN72616.1 protein RodZ, contains Xre-like HTH and DUF4115 domains [Sphingomonas gellani]